MRNDVSAGMQALCEDIIAGYSARKITLAFVKDESHAIRGDARLFIGQCQILRHQRANALRKELAAYRKVLAPAVHAFLEECRNRQQELHSDLLDAGRAWRAMAAELKQRRGQSTEG